MKNFGKYIGEGVNYFFERASNSKDTAKEKPSIKASSASISDNSFIQSNTLSIREKVSFSVKILGILNKK